MSDLLVTDIQNLREILATLDDGHSVKADAGTGISASTVKELKALDRWPPGLILTPPPSLDRVEVPVQIRPADKQDTSLSLRNRNRRPVVPEF
jgi:hypothetical protein